MFGSEKVKRQDKDLKLLVGFSYCAFKKSGVFILLFLNIYYNFLIEMCRRKLSHTPSCHPDNFFEIKWTNACLIHC